MSKPLVIMVELDHVDQLFEEPDFNPFDESKFYSSGIDYIYGELKASPLRDRSVVKIVLPPSEITPSLGAEIQAAIRRYCKYEIHQNQIEVRATRWKGWKALQSGVVILAVCLILATIVDNLPFVPEFWSNFFGEGLVIIGWVSLWTPTEILLYEWWPYWRENRILQYMAEMDVVIEPQAV